MIIVGDMGVGKTSLLRHYVINDDAEEQKEKDSEKNKDKLGGANATLGVEQYAKRVILKNDVHIKACFWDTAGSEKFRSLTTAHFRKAVGALVVFDLTSRESFKNVYRWINEVKENAESDCQIILVGNKCDLCTKATVDQPLKA